MRHNLSWVDPSEQNSFWPETWDWKWEMPSEWSRLEVEYPFITYDTNQSIARFLKNNGLISNFGRNLIQDIDKLQELADEHWGEIICKIQSWESDQQLLVLRLLTHQEVNGDSEREWQTKWDCIYYFDGEWTLIERKTKEALTSRRDLNDQQKLLLTQRQKQVELICDKLLIDTESWINPENWLYDPVALEESKGLSAGKSIPTEFLLLGKWKEFTSEREYDLQSMLNWRLLVSDIRERIAKQDDPKISAIIQKLEEACDVKIRYIIKKYITPTWDDTKAKNAVKLLDEIMKGLYPNDPIWNSEKAESDKVTQSPDQLETQAKIATTLAEEWDRWDGESTDERDWKRVEAEWNDIWVAVLTENEWDEWEMTQEPPTENTWEWEQRPQKRWDFSEIWKIAPLHQNVDYMIEQRLQKVTILPEGNPIVINDLIIDNMIQNFLDAAYDDRSLDKSKRTETGLWDRIEGMRKLWEYIQEKAIRLRDLPADLEQKELERIQYLKNLTAKKEIWSSEKLEVLVQLITLVVQIRDFRQEMIDKDSTGYFWDKDVFRLYPNEIKGQQSFISKLRSIVANDSDNSEAQKRILQWYRLAFDALQWEEKKEMLAKYNELRSKWAMLIQAGVLKLTPKPSKWRVKTLW